MRELILKMEVSVDGFVAAVERDVRGWIEPGYDEELTAYVVDLLSGAGTHVMGRVAFEDMAGHWPTSREPFAVPMNEIPKVVFSRTLTDPSWAGRTVAAGDLGEEIGRLRACFAELSVDEGSCPLACRSLNSIIRGRSDSISSQGRFSVERSQSTLLG